jgi:hypothetical protein
MALPIPGLRSLPLPSPPTPPLPPLPERELTPTLRRVELGVWTLCVVLTATLVFATLAGAFVVASRPLTLPVAAPLVSVAVGTLAFVAADVIFG